MPSSETNSMVMQRDNMCMILLFLVTVFSGSLTPSGSMAEPERGRTFFVTGMTEQTNRKGTHETHRPDTHILC